MLLTIEPENRALTIDTVARTAWAEARGCGSSGMRHVINTMVNRALHPRWWGHDLISVCRQPWQYSCWNAGDPNLPKLLAVTVADRQFRLARELAEAACDNDLPDQTDGADSYYALDMTRPPFWAAHAVRTMQDAWHAFFRVGLAQVSNVGASTLTTAGALRLHAVPPPAVSADDLNAAELLNLRSWT